MEKKADIHLALKNCNKKNFTVLVSHNPDILEKINPGTVDLVLSGHTHGGQVTFFGLFVPYLPNKTGKIYRSGLFKISEKKISLLVSNGLGTTFIPLRFFAPPEFHVIRLFPGSGKHRHR